MQHIFRIVYDETEGIVVKKLRAVRRKETVDMARPKLNQFYQFSMSLSISVIYIYCWNLKSEKHLFRQSCLVEPLIRSSSNIFFFFFLFVVLIISIFNFVWHLIHVTVSNQVITGTL